MLSYQRQLHGYFHTVAKYCNSDAFIWKFHQVHVTLSLSTQAEGSLFESHEPNFQAGHVAGPLARTNRGRGREGGALHMETSSLQGRRFNTLIWQGWTAHWPWTMHCKLWSVTKKPLMDAALKWVSMTTKMASLSVVPWSSLDHCTS